MKWTARRRKFREILSGSRCYHPASVYDPITVRIAEEIGFEVAMLAGSTAAMSIIGSPDLGLITLSELCEQTHRISRASSLPLFVDADHGFGNALSVQRTVGDLEDVGAAAISIEDTLLPPSYGQGAAHRLISLDEAAGKIRAAIAARRDPDLIIVARTTVSTGLEDAVTRARAYEKAGADAVFLANVRVQDEIGTVASALSIPLMLGPPSENLMDMEKLAASRVRICLKGHAAMMAGYRAYYETQKVFRTGVAPSALPDVPPNDMVARLTRAADYAQAGMDFLGG